MLPARLYRCELFSSRSGLQKLPLIPPEMTVRFGISDSGLGIPKDDSKRIFERFRQLSPLDKNKVVGSGMSLYNSREIIALHGVTLDVASIPGNGATLTCILPVA